MSRGARTTRQEGSPLLRLGGGRSLFEDLRAHDRDGGLLEGMPRSDHQRAGRGIATLIVAATGIAAYGILSFVAAVLGQEYAQGVARPGGSLVVVRECAQDLLHPGPAPFDRSSHQHQRRHLVEAVPPSARRAGRPAARVPRRRSAGPPARGRCRARRCAARWWRFLDAGRQQGCAGNATPVIRGCCSVTACTTFARHEGWPGSSSSSRHRVWLPVVIGFDLPVCGWCASVAGSGWSRMPF